MQIQYNCGYFLVVPKVEVATKHVFCSLIFALGVHNKNKLYLISQLNLNIILKVIKDRYDLKKSREIVRNSNRSNADLYFLDKPEKKIEGNLFMSEKNISN